MGTFSTGIGLASGIDSASYIDQIMAIEGIPVRRLQARIQGIDLRRTAFVDISARLLAVKNIIARFSDISFFKRFSSTSSNENILTATAGESAVPGSYDFRVHSLVTHHSVVSRGFADADTTPVGVGTLSLELGHGKVNPLTLLDTLNGGRGVQRGTITITDRGGNSAEIDLSKAVSVNDVLDAINSASEINVRAFVTSLGAGGDRIVIEDTTADADVTGNLIVADDPGRTTAADLGIAGDVSAATIEGTDIVYLADSTALSLLNDGNGIGRVGFGTDADLNFDAGSYGSFTVSLSDVLALDTNLAALNSGNGVRLGTIRITNGSGDSAEIDLSSAVTVRDVRDAINASGIDVSATTVNSHFQITDNSEQVEGLDQKLTIEDVSGFAAADMGIAGSAAGTAIFGRDVYRVSTIGDVIRAINYAPDNNSLVEARISDDGNGIVLSPLGFTVEPIVVTSLNGSTAAADLGIEGATFDSDFQTRDLLAGLNTVLLQTLNGGSGADAGVVSFTDRAGNSGSIDFTGVATLQEVIDLINSDANPTSIVASVNSAGNGLELRDESEGGGLIVIGDVSGSLAQDLGIAGTFSAGDLDGDGAINGGNLELQYVARQTSLSELNAGRGISSGKMRITDGTGAVIEVNISSGLKRVGQIIDAINGAAQDRDEDGTKDIEARINDTGDGIVVIDHTAGGVGPLKIEDVEGGRVAVDLRLAGTARESENFIDGSYEIRIDISASDTLDDIAAKIEGSGGGVSASILNSNSPTNPYSLTITSSLSGRAGEMVIDAGGIDLGFSTLTRPQDALVSVGGADDADSLLITSSTNTLEGVIEGVTIDLLSAGDETVTLNVAQDVDGMIEDIKDFVTRYNDVQGAIDSYTGYNQDTEERGILLGDGTVNTIRTRLHSVIAKQYTNVSDSFSWLGAVGIRLGANNQVEFDEDRFREVYAESPQEVEQLFTAAETGFGDVVEETIDVLTRDFDGLLARKDNLLEDQRDLLSDRIVALNELLDAKRTRLEAQFVALEQAILALQGQQSALASLTSLFAGA